MNGNLNEENISASDLTSSHTYISSSIFGVISWKDKNIIYRQLSSSVGAGLALNRAVELSCSALDKNLLQDILGLLNSGNSLSQTLSRYPRYFTIFEVAIVQAGEVSGTLEESLRQLAEYAEEKERRRKELVSMAIYPTLLLHMAAFIPTLPILITSCPLSYILAVSTILGPIYIFAFLVWFVGQIAKSNESLAFYISSLNRYIPVSGKLASLTAQVHFLKAFARLHQAGILASQSLSLAALSCGNAYWAKQLSGLDKAIDAGKSPSMALRDSGLFSEHILGMLTSGEETGHIGEMALKASQLLNEDIATYQKRLLAILPAILLLLVGALVGKQIIGTFMEYASVLQGVI